jgi:hypothetical protein
LNVTEVAPAGIVTEAGTLAVEGLLLERRTTNPPLGAGCEILTVPVEGLGCMTAAGLSVTETIAGVALDVAPELAFEVTISRPLSLPLSVAVMRTVVRKETA